MIMLVHLIYILLVVFFVTKMFKEQVDRNDGSCADDGFAKHSESAKASYGSCTPDGSCCRQTFDRIAVFEDDTGSKETDTGNHLCDNTAVISANYRWRHEHISRFL